MTSAGPLSGRTVMVTRGVAKGDELGARLEAVGAHVVRVPMIATEPLASAARLTAAVEQLGSGSGTAWLVLTSETAVELLFDHAGAPLALDRVSTAVVGPATAAALGAHGVEADVVAPGQVAESLAGELLARGVSGAAVLVVAAAGGRDVIAPALRAGGARVEVIGAYRSVLPPGAAGQLRAALATAMLDAVTFTSGSTVAHFAQALHGASLPGCAAVCIGPVTAAVARDKGWETVVTAAEHSARGLAAAVVSLLGAHPLP